MARTLPAAIQTALQQSGQQPYFSVTLQDLIARYSTFAQGTTNGRTDALVSPAGTLIRALVGQGADPNNLLVQRITSPSTASQWSAAYATVASSVAKAAAGCALATDGVSRIRLFYQRNSDSAIVYRDSTDDGQTWGAETLVLAAPTGQSLCYGICSDNPNRVFAIFAAFSYAACGFYRSSFTTSWSAWSNEGPSSPTGWGQLRGLSCVAISGTVYFAAGVQIKNALTGIGVSTCTYNGTTYSAWSQVQPLDNGNIGITLSNPHIHWDAAGGNWYLTILAGDNGSVSGTTQTRLTVLQSPDFSTWSVFAHLGTGLSYEAHSMVLASVVYSFDGASTFTAPAGPAATDVSNDVLSLSISEAGNQPQRMSLTLSNESGQYNNHPSVRVDARITFAFGYGTTLLTTHLMVIDTFTYQVAAGVRELTIQGRSIAKLLDYPQSRFLLYQSQTIAQLVTAICKQAGVALAALPGTQQFSQTVPCFVIAPGETWLQALDRVGAIYGFDHFSDQTPQLRVVERQAGDASTWSYGTEAFGLSYGQSADQANAIRVAGQSTSSTATQPAFCDTFDNANILAEGRERFRNIVDRQLTTGAQCKIRGGLALREEQMNATHGQLIVTINPQHELFDVITMSDTSIGLTNQAMRIHGIEWHVDPEKGSWEQRLQLSGV